MDVEESSEIEQYYGQGSGDEGEPTYNWTIAEWACFQLIQAEEKALRVSMPAQVTELSDKSSRHPLSEENAVTDVDNYAPVSLDLYDIFNASDLDHDGQLTLDEFKHY